MIDLTNILVTADNNQKYICDADTDKKYLCDAEDRMITFAGERGETGPQGPQGPQGEPGEVTEAELTAALALKANVADLGTMSAESASDYYTKTATDTLLSAKANSADLGSLADQDTVNYQTEVTNKPTLGALADHDTVNYSTEVTNKPTLGTMSSESASDYYDKTEVYDKAEVDSLINGSGVVGEKTVSGSIVTFETTLAENLGELKVGIDPVQDLNGYDAPWPAGGGKNLLPMTLANMKTINPAGTWSGNTYTLYDVAYTVNTDDGGNVTSIKVNGTASAYSLLRLYNEITFTSDTILSGCASGGSYSGYMLRAEGGTARIDVGSGVTIPANETKSTIIIAVYSGYTLTNAMFYPMVRLATDADATFAPYSNICPISGHTGANVYRTGKNLLDISLLTMFNSNTYVMTENYTRRGTISVKPDTSYKLSHISHAGDGRIYFYDAEGNALSSYASIGSSNPKTFTTPENCATIGYYCRITSDTTLYTEVSQTKPMLTLASDTDDTYSAYSGTSVTIDLNGTRYGGTLDVVNGVLTVTHALQTFNGTEAWSLHGSIASWFFVDNAFSQTPYVNSSEYDFAIANAFKQTLYANASIMVNGKFAYGVPSPNTIRLAVKYTGCSTVAQFKTWLGSNNLQVVYKLATPTVVTLTANQISASLGTNVMWASTGDIEVGYYTNDTAEAINDTRQMMADTTTTMTAPRNLTVNEFVIVNNRLYQLTANVASGSALVVGTNVTETTVAEVLTALLNA